MFYQIVNIPVVPKTTSGPLSTKTKRVVILTDFWYPLGLGVNDPQRDLLLVLNRRNVGTKSPFPRLDGFQFRPGLSGVRTEPREGRGRTSDRTSFLSYLDRSRPRHPFLLTYERTVVVGSEFLVHGRSPSTPSHDQVSKP